MLDKKPDKKCSIWWCNDRHYAKGYCVKHYRAVQRTGSPYGEHKEDMEKINQAIDLGRQISEDVLNIPWVDCPFCDHMYGMPHLSTCTIHKAGQMIRSTE